MNNRTEIHLNPRDSINYDPIPNETHDKSAKSMQYVATLVVCLGAVTAGTAIAWSSPVLSQISGNHYPNKFNNRTSELQLTPEQQSWVTSLLPIGAVFGACSASYIADIVGRRSTALLLALVFIISYLLLYFAKTFEILYVGRFFIGIPTGGFCVVAPMYIAEIAQMNLKGTLGIMFQLMLTFGILFVYAIGAFVNWKSLTALCLIAPIALFFGMLFLPETPTYLLMKGKQLKATQSLNWLWGRHSGIHYAIQGIQLELKESRSNVSYLDLFRTRAVVKGLTISICLMLFQQLSGINAIIFYTVDIFRAADGSIHPSICSILVAGVQVITTFFSSMLIERTGRKLLLITSSLVMLLCLSLLGMYFHLSQHEKDLSTISYLPLIAVVLYIIFFSIGYGPIPWLMMGEWFLPDIKSIAIGVVVMTNWIFAFVVTKFFNVMVLAWGLDFTFWFFASCMLLATTFVIFLIIETKSKTSTEIQSWLKGEKY